MWTTGIWSTSGSLAGQNCISCSRPRKLIVKTRHEYICFCCSVSESVLIQVRLENMQRFISLNRSIRTHWEFGQTKVLLALVQTSKAEQRIYTALTSFRNSAQTNWHFSDNSLTVLEGNRFCALFYCRNNFFQSMAVCDSLVSIFVFFFFCNNNSVKTRLWNFIFCSLLFPSVTGSEFHSLHTGIYHVLCQRPSHFSKRCKYIYIVFT